MWVEADEAGNLEMAQKYLDEALTKAGVAPQML